MHGTFVLILMQNLAVLNKKIKIKNSGLVCSKLCSYQLCFVAKPLGGVSSQDFGSLQHLPAMSLRSEIFRKCLYCNLDQIKP